MLVDDTQHDSQQRHTEDVVAVGEEASPSDQDSTNVVPTKRRLVDLGEGKSSTLIGILNATDRSVNNPHTIGGGGAYILCEIIVEVMERSVSASSLGSHGHEALPRLGQEFFQGLTAGKE